AAAAGATRCRAVPRGEIRYYGRAKSQRPRHPTLGDVKCKEEFTGMLQKALLGLNASKPAFSLIHSISFMKHVPCYKVVHEDKKVTKCLGECGDITHSSIDTPSNKYLANSCKYYQDV
uniref:Uncharacterized protein n=1 Tax=Romanomermis culicivorax TaxID=13658 RepID=A0A915JAY4_ROMCU